MKENTPLVQLQQPGPPPPRKRKANMMGSAIVSGVHAAAASVLKVLAIPPKSASFGLASRTNGSPALIRSSSASSFENLSTSPLFYAEGALSHRLHHTLLTVTRADGLVNQYRLTDDRGYVRYYRCSSCDYLCRQEKDKESYRATASIRNGALKLTEERHHDKCVPLTPEEVAAKEVDRKARAEAKEAHFPPRAIYAKACELVLAVSEQMGDVNSVDSAAVQLPTWQKVRRQFGRHVQSAMPTVQSAYDLPERYKITKRATLSGSKERWLLVSDEDAGVIIFATDQGLRAAANSDILSGDGTFSRCPRDFYQFYTCHMKIADKNGNTDWQPFAFCLMASKTERAYSFLFTTLRKKWIEMECTPKFRRLITDFERAQLNAISSTFGSERVSGCLYHFTQALFRSVQEKGLGPFYARKFAEFGVIRMWVRQALALPLLPPHMIRSVWHYVLSQPPIPPPDGWEPPEGYTHWPENELNEFSKYVQDNWIDGMVPSWYSQWTNDYDRTNNASESYHAALKREPGFLFKPSMTTFMPALQRFHARQESRLMQIEGGGSVYKRNKKYIKRDLRLKQYKIDLKKEMLESADTASIMQAALRYLTRCSFVLAENDFDKKGKKNASKKATSPTQRAARAKLATAKKRLVKGVVKPK